VAEHIELTVELENGTIGPVPVEHLGGDRYQLWFYAPLSDYEFGNIVEAELVSDDLLRIRRLVDQGGWKTIYLALTRERMESEALKAVLADWERRGLHWERMMGGFLLAHIPPGCDFDPLPGIEALL
jgi:hypothetical protein